MVVSLVLMVCLFFKFPNRVWSILEFLTDHTVHLTVLTFALEVQLLNHFLEPFIVVNPQSLILHQEWLEYADHTVPLI
jgi:hypothetical protein